jgi:PAS domain S-box-containing protein
MKKQPTVGRRGQHASEADDPHLSRERYRVFIEDVADGFYETDLKGNFKYFNHALCRIFGHSRDEIQDRNFREFMDAKNAESTFRYFNQVYRTGEGITDMIWEIVRKDGQTRVIELSANLITDEQSNKLGFRGIARDISEKYLAQLKAIESEQLASCQYEASRRAEKRYRAFLNFLPIPVFVFNLDSTVSYLNPAFEQTFGWSFKELEGKRIPFVPDSHRAQTRQGVKKLFENKILHGFETKRLTRDGRLLDIIIDGAVFYDENNQPAGQVITLRDVTPEKRMARVNEALFRISKALYQFRSLDDRLEFITREVQALLAIEAALVILTDEEKNEFFFRAEALPGDTPAPGQRRGRAGLSHRQTDDRPRLLQQSSFLSPGGRTDRFSYPGHGAGAHLVRRPHDRRSGCREPERGSIRHDRRGTVERDCRDRRPAHRERPHQRSAAKFLRRG